MAVKPITPEGVVEKQQETIPDEMLEAVNELLVECVTAEGKAKLAQKVVCERFVAKTGGRYTAEDVVDRNWLGFAGLYEEVGWEVAYRMPTEDEDFAPYFEFATCE